MKSSSDRPGVILDSKLPTLHYLTTTVAPLLKEMKKSIRVNQAVMLLLIETT